MLMAITGKTNCGKSTLFSAATMVDVEISNRTFTTIKPNRGVAYVTTKCVHEELGKKCQPQNSKCENGVRLIPTQILDIAGLVPDAHKGRGLGNEFLNDIMQANALIHVLDAAGSTDIEGNPCAPGNHNPANDVRFLEKEIDYWVKGILTKNWQKISKQATATKKPAEALGKQLSGLGITEDDTKEVLAKKGFGEKPDEWNDAEILRFAGEIRKRSKPMLIAANKIDLPDAKENFEKLKKEFPQHIFVPCCAEAELALRKAAKQGLIEYVPGATEFKELKEIPTQQKKALKFIQEKVLDVWGNTGIQQTINKTAFELLRLIVVYPVEDAHKFADSKGRVLPDAYLVREGATAHDLAAKIHSSFVERFVAAIDCKTGQKLGKEHALKMNDVVKIQLSH